MIAEIVLFFGLVVITVMLILYVVSGEEND